MKQLRLFAALIALLATLAACTAGGQATLRDNSISSEAEWDELPEHVRAAYAAMAEAAAPDQRLDRPPYPAGGMAAIMRRLTYPVDARVTGVQGQVVVRALVDEEGEVISASVLRSVHPSLDREALAAVRESRFRPGMREGKPVQAEVCAPITFRLR